MSRIRCTFTLLFLVMTTSLFAQASRTWVSGNGDDTSSCARTAPCKTWAGAFGKTAAGGEIDAMDAGGFGGLTITKGIRIDGRGFVASTFASSFVVNTTGHVELANLQFNGDNQISTGISVTSAGSLLIDNVDLTNYTSIAISISVPTTTPVQILNSRIHNLGPGASGVYGTATSGTLRLRITDSTINDMSGNGVFVSTGAFVTLDRTQIAGCSSAIRADNSSLVNVSESTLIHNSGYGVYAPASGALIRVYNSFIQDNTAGGYDVSAPSVIQSTISSSIQMGIGSAIQSIGLQ